MADPASLQDSLSEHPDLIDSTSGDASEDLSPDLEDTEERASASEDSPSEDTSFDDYASVASPS